MKNKKCIPKTLFLKGTDVNKVLQELEDNKPEIGINTFLEINAWHKEIRKIEEELNKELDNLQNEPKESPYAPIGCNRETRICNIKNALKKLRELKKYEIA